jgi:hypothetical protein
MSTITINGNTYSGNNIVVTKGKVIINGKDVTPDSKEININVEGNIEELKVDTCDSIIINGDVSNITTQSGDVEISGNVTGSIQTMSGDVDCGTVGGSISTMSGDIKHRRS